MSFSRPAEGSLDIALPDPCEPRSEHVIRAICSPDGVEEICTFRCPGEEDTYAAAVMADTPVAFYRFEETGGDVITDSSGNGHDSVAITNAVLGVTGTVGNGLLLGGNATVELDLQLDMADPDGPDAEDNDFSIEVFLRPATEGVQSVVLAQQDGETGLGRSNLLAENADGRIGSFLGGSTTSSSAQSPS